MSAAASIPAITLDKNLIPLLKTDGDGALFADLNNATTAGGTLDLNNGVSVKIEFSVAKDQRNGGKVIFGSDGTAIGFIPNAAPAAAKETRKSGSMAARPNL